MAFNTGGHIPVDGLEINLDIFNIRSYPGSGTNVYNVSRGIYTGAHVITGTGFVYEDGIPTIECSGSDIMTADTSIRPTYGNEYSYVCFTKMMNDHGSWRTLIRGTPGDHIILVQTGTNLLGFYDNGGTSFNSSGYDISPHAETWFSICVNATGVETTDFYINSELVGTVGQNASGNAHHTIGNFSALNQPWGWVSQVLYYNRQLITGEIKGIHEAFKSRYGL